LMLDIQNMKVSKAIYIFFGAGISLFFWQGNRGIAGIEHVR
jgi:hypothetical protein